MDYPRLLHKKIRYVRLLSLVVEAQTGLNRDSSVEVGTMQIDPRFKIILTLLVLAGMIIAFLVIPMFLGKG